VRVLLKVGRIEIAEVLITWSSLITGLLSLQSFLTQSLVVYSNRRGHF
jgi:hypothetical protein